MDTLAWAGVRGRLDLGGRGERALVVVRTGGGEHVLTALSADCSSKPPAIIPRAADRYGRGADADKLAAAPARLAVIVDRPMDRAAAASPKRSGCRSLLVRCPCHLKRRDPRAHDVHAEHGAGDDRSRPRLDSLANHSGLHLARVRCLCFVSGRRRSRSRSTDIPRGEGSNAHRRECSQRWRLGLLACENASTPDQSPLETRDLP